MVADPWGEQPDDQLRHDDQPGHQDRGGLIVMFCQVLADDWEHRSVGKLEQEDTGSEDIEFGVFAEIENTLKALGLLAHACITRTRVIDLVATNPA